MSMLYLMRSKPQNVYLYKTAFSRRLLRFQTSQAIYDRDVTMQNGVFFNEVSRSNLKTTSYYFTERSFLAA